MGEEGKSKLDKLETRMNEMSMELWDIKDMLQNFMSWDPPNPAPNYTITTSPLQNSILTPNYAFESPFNARPTYTNIHSTILQPNFQWTLGHTCSSPKVKPKDRWTKYNTLYYNRSYMAIPNQGLATFY